MATGDNDQQVVDWMVARYGDFVRLRPPFRLGTLDPVGLPGAGFGGGRRSPSGWRGAAVPAPPAPLSAAEQTRLAKLLER